jgi:ribosomal protein L35AE/L33A
MADYDGILSLSGGVTKRVNSSGDNIIIRPALKFEGESDDGVTTELAFVDPTQNNTITFPNDTGTVVINTNGGIEEALMFKAKNASGAQIFSGSAVRITGISGEVPTVDLTDASDSSTMPCFGLAYNTANNNAEVDIITFGNIQNIDTSGFSVGDIIYVNTGSGEISNVKPSGSSNSIQNIGKVLRSHANNGIIKVGGAGRSAATPNLDNGKFFIGDSSNYSSQSSYTLPTADGNANEVLTTNGTGQVSFQPISNLNVPSFLVYGQDATLTNQTSAFEMKTTNGSQNGQGWRMPVGGSVTHMSLQLDLENTPTSDTDVVLELYKNGSATGKTLTLSISSTSSIGDFGINGTITAETFSAGDRLTVFINHSASGLQTGNHAATIRILTATT